MRSRVFAVAAAILATPTLVWAQPEPVADAAAPVESSGEGVAPTAEEAACPLSLSLTLDWVSGYYWRGIVSENSGFILQPGATLTWAAIENEDVSLEFNVGTWHSFHSIAEASGTENEFVKHWYETDVSGGMELGVGAWSIAGVYQYYGSASESFDSVQAIDVTLGYDDSECLGDWAVQPYVMYSFEIGADGSDGADLDRGQYLELGIEPGYEWEPKGDAGRTISLTFPTSVGLSLGDFYQDETGDDDTFGFAQSGVKASIPMGEWAGGDWSLIVGMSLMYLGDHAAEYNDDQELVIIGSIGIAAEF
jgi:hypothetical protein